MGSDSSTCSERSRFARNRTLRAGMILVAVLAATEGVRAEIPTILSDKIHKGSGVIDLMKDGGIGMLINTPSGRMSAQDDSYIRKAAIKHRVPYITTITAATAAVRGIAEQKKERSGVKSLQAYHRNIV